MQSERPTDAKFLKHKRAYPIRGGPFQISGTSFSCFNVCSKQMNRNQLLTVTSLLSIFLLVIHVIDDIVRGFDSAGLQNMIGIAVVAALLYGTLVLRERLAGIISMLVVSIFAAGMPVIHLRSARINEIAQSSGGYFFILILWMLGILGIFGIILAVELLLRRRRNKGVVEGTD